MLDAIRSGCPGQIIEAFQETWSQERKDREEIKRSKAV